MNRYNKLRSLIQMLIIAGVMLLSLTTWALDMGDSLIRDYPVSLTLPKNRLELSLDYLRIDDATDVFSIRDKEIDTISETYHSDTLSDMTGFRAIMNYGLFDKTTLQGGFTYRDMDVGLGSIRIKSLDLSFKQNIFNDPSAEPFLAFDVGLRYNYSGGQTFSDETGMNAALGRFAKGVTLEMDNSTVRFIEKNNGSANTYSIARDGIPDPEISNDSTSDVTPYVRITAGKILGVIFPNFFAEFGKTRINSSIDFSLKDSIPEEVRDRFPELPIDLDRREDYIKAGICLLWKYPYMLMGRIEYNYLKLFRDDSLDYVDDNHIIKADLNWFITPKLIFNIGGVYYHWQFNGVIPFLYNEYTQTTFDHKYGRLQVGFTYLFGR